MREIVDSYLETALWSSHDWDDLDDRDNPTPFDKNYDCSDWSDEAKTEAYEDCKRFVELLESYELDDDSDYDNLYEAAEDMQSDGHIGHDFG